MRGISLFVGLLVACGGSASRPKQRVPGGERASVASLIKLLGAVRSADSPGPLLAEGVFEQCGKACACLDFGEGGDAEGRIGMCRDVWKDQAPPGSGIDWRALTVIGAYLADQHAAAGARDREALADAMAGLIVSLVPAAGSLGVAPPAATQIAGYGVGRHVLTIDAQGAVRGGVGPTALFTPTGATFVPAELKPLADADAIAAFVRGLDPDVPPPAPEEEEEEAEAPPPDPSLESGVMGKLERREGQYQMRPSGGSLLAGAARTATHSATGTDARIPSHALTIVADRGAPGAKLVEVMALAKHSVIAVARGDELGTIMLVFGGARAGAPGGMAGGWAVGQGGAGRFIPAELEIEVGDAPAFRVGNRVARDHVPVAAADPALLRDALAEKLKDPAFDGRRDVAVAVREQARVAAVVAAVDAALAAGGRPVHVESWHERPPGLGVGGLGILRDPAAGGMGHPPVHVGASATGSLDKEIIRRYIKRALPEIRHCYEKQLVSRPTIAGTVQAQFFISPSGAVTTSTATGVDPQVADCVAAVIQKIKFPKPTGGGGVQVSYPFTFRTTE